MKKLQASNSTIRLARPSLGAAFLLFVSLLYPLEVFAANCKLKTAPVCVDSTPCKDVQDNVGNTVKVCLSTAIAPVGALVVSKPCWQYKAVYDCMDQSTPTYTDTCKQVRDGGSCANYAELSATCNNDLPKLANGACPLFDVKYSCETAPGNPYTETTCSSSTSCVDQNGNPSFCTGPVAQETNTSVGKVAAAQEMSRQAGVYADKGVNPAESDPDKILLFKGEGARCSEGMWGLAPNCCKPDSKGASATNALITQQLVAAGWNQIAQAYVGSGYMYDTLLDKTVDLVTKALGAMQQVMGGVLNGTTTIATTAANIAGGAAGVASSISLTNTGDMIGGAIGGAVLGAAAGQYAIKLGANTGFAGTVTAVGSAIGTIGGTYLAGVAMYAGEALVSSTVSFTAAGAASAGSEAIAAICTPCMVGMLVFSILMSFAACSPDEVKTQLKLGAPGLCHFVGTYCNTKDIFGGCITTMQSYCCFNSRIARIVQEGAKGTSSAAGQLGSWGSSRTPDCSGIKTTDLNKLDFSKIDLSEFIQDVTANSVPTGNDAASVVATHTQAYFDANQVDPTATDGLLVTGSVQQLAPPAIPMNDTSTLDNPPPSMMACSVAFKVTNMVPDGTTTGDFDISDCNPNAIIVLNNQGNCAASPATSLDPSSSDFTSATVSLDGKAKFSITLPPSCFAVTSPPTQNIWKGLVTLSPYGTLGVIDAIWQ